MEAVPRLPMLSFALKSSPEGTSFSGLKRYIAECYQEDPESYSKEVYALEKLRNSAMRPAKDVTGCATLKRYYCQLHSLSNRFPNLSDRNLFTFVWKDLYSNNVTAINDIRYEMATVLYNVAAVHTQLGAAVNRVDVDGMKLACTHYQCAAWAFGELKEKYTQINSGNDFLTPELLIFMQQISFAQAQECILEKSLIDNRKPAVVAKVTSQIINYYSAALVALLSGGDDGNVAEVVGSSVYKEWKKYVKFKISYLNCILLLYQGQQAEEQQKMGERVVLYQVAWDKLEEARKESKGMSEFQKEINESLTFTADVVEAKRKAAKNENEFIYHEAVPNISDIAAVQGANLVNGISFSVTDPDVAGEDIFARLVPMEAHEASSLYSEEKAQLLRKIGAKIEEKDNELNKYMSSLSIEHLNISEERANKIPQGIVDRCASLNAKTNAIPDLISSMSNLAEICADVETNLKEIKELLNEEEKNEKQYQQKSGVRRSLNSHFTELSREFQKYMEAHQKAGESNDTLRRAMELHVNNLRILSRPLQDIQSSVPKLSGEVNESVFHELKLLLNKVNEMKAQRAQFHADLRIAINNDDITSKVIAFGGEENDESGGKEKMKELFKKEIAKHDKICALIEQNLVAQGNILTALTDTYAKCAPLLKTLADVKHKKENFYSSLAASYDVYEDLLAKSAKGLEFYKKLQGNVVKLLTRVRAARDVQDEERQQRLKSSSKSSATITDMKYQSSGIGGSLSISGTAAGIMPSSTPKLKDYLKSGKIPSALASSDVAASTYIPPIRPNPLGSEAPTTSSCVNNSISSYYTTQSFSSQLPPNEPPPPYAMSATVGSITGQQSLYSSDTSGYINPIYQYPQNIDIASSSTPYNTQTYYQNSIQNPLQTAYQQQTVYQQPNSAATNQDQTTSKYLSSQQYQYPSSLNYSTPVSQYPSQNPEISNPYQQQSQYQTYTQQSLNYPTQQYDTTQQQQQNAYAQQLPQSMMTTSAGGHTQQLPQSSAAITTSAGGYIQQLPQSSAAITTSAGGYIEQQQNSTVVGYSTTNPLSSSTATPQYSQPQQTAQQHQQTLSTSIAATYNQSDDFSSAGVISHTKYQQPIPAVTSPAISSSLNKATNQIYSAALPTSTTQTISNNDKKIVTSSDTSGWSGITGLNTQMDNLKLQQTNQTAYGYHSMQQQQQQYTIPDQNNTGAVLSQQQYTVPISSTGITSLPYGNQTSSYSSHPGYLFNNITGEYQYGSGYQVDSNFQQIIFGQYTNAIPNQGSNTTDSTSQSVVGQTFANQYSNSVTTNQQESDNVSYYNTPYGYQSNMPTQQTNVNISTGINLQQGSNSVTLSTDATMNKGVGSTYMQSNSYNGTQTTVSGNYTDSAVQQQQQQQQQTPSQSQQQQSTKSTLSKKKSTTSTTKKSSSNIDLLSDIDFSSSVSLPTPPLQPQPASITSETKSDITVSNSSQQELSRPQSEPSSFKNENVVTTKESSISNSFEQSNKTVPTVTELETIYQVSTPLSDSMDQRKLSCDNLSICSDLSSLDQNFEWDSISVQSGIGGNNDKSPQHKLIESSSKSNYQNPFDDPKILKYFHKEVERYEKMIESLNVKMLNGNTPLKTKWNELQELLMKDESKHSTSIGKLFPEKNRSIDCIPYDHARVVLERSTDNYINAAFVKDLGPSCPVFILTQTPLQNTLNDFWSMVWSQKSRTLVCLHTPNEILDTFWPQQLNQEMHFDDYSVVLVKQLDLSHCIEYNLKLTMNGADAILNLSLLQIKAWTKSLPSQILGIAENVLTAYKQKCHEFKKNQPLIMNCLTGSERSGLITVAICTILATQTRRPILINVIDVWYRICSQRRSALKDTDNLQLSMQIVLCHAHDLLNKRGIMTSYQMKNAQIAAAKEKEDIKDPLNDLDPLWKLKQK